MGSSLAPNPTQWEAKTFLPCGVRFL
jgi:hypothetical protein